jgi:hypothetical protein
METEKKWKTAPISATCQVLRGHKLCDLPTEFAYPAMGGGWMALCYRHGLQHVGSGGAQKIEVLITNGEKFG